MKLAPPVIGGEICGRWGGERETATHWGIDLCTNHVVGLPIYNLVPGTVSDVTSSEHGGNQIVMYWGKYKGQPVYARHSHCDRILRREGEYVRQHEILATVGKTGVNAAGRPISAHLHLQLMDRISGGDPINTPQFLYDLGIEEHDLRLYWRPGYPNHDVFYASLAGFGSVVAFLTIWILTGSKTAGLAAAVLPP